MLSKDKTKFENKTRFISLVNFVFNIFLSIALACLLFIEKKDLPTILDGHYFSAIQFQLTLLQAGILFLAIFLSALGFIGYQSVKEDAKNEARKVAEDEARDEARKVATDEMRRQVGAYTGSSADQTLINSNKDSAEERD